MKEIEDIFAELLKVSISKYIIAGIVIILALCINKYIVTKIFDYIIRIVKRTKTFADDSLVRALEKPIKLYIMLFSFYASLKIIDFDGLNVNAVTSDRLKKIFIVIVICYFFYNLTLENSFLYTRMHRNDGGNTIVFPFVSIIIRLVIIVIGISCIAREFGFTGFITGLGISGVAFALMAQDTFSNLFGGVIIVLDRPFAIGDWIQTSQVEGIVEDITFRSTRIRTFSMAVATVPNSKLANENIINWTQRKLRRIHFKFTIKFDTEVEKIKNCVNRIEELLKSHEKIDKDLIIVSFNELSTYGFGVFVYFYTNELNYTLYEKLKEEINMEILRILREEDVGLMFLTFNFGNGLEHRGGNCETECTELESIRNITEEERGK
ncbi:mechanosensitive ion channel family protein [Clostridium tertium]|uniref:mechanosensitive ion channel family protein n=1 Tax=Clostridium TaxID=1485 RepID=UPI002330D362|nr:MULTISPECIES: mechanosensitive ion channel family protein [Clostridium]MDB1953560.1 mechanosensitive ion channel family protein [Clostridium tertium]MDB1960405.1 mechanosensitive ion channel family protein [Clostridium tertium]MDB1962907.1 mechanosensitive ion channel family protein [Clostridium tertium]MDB1964630.1 mechanosensitive ion channel family protein [Clostridium tertium]MDU2682807.1 mechanosensitive ion channel family protein [Clostridium sp.]